MTDHFDPDPSDKGGPGGLALVDLGPTEARTFDDSDIQASINRAIASLDADDHAATVLHATKRGVGLSTVVRIKAGWSIQAAVFKEWSGAPWRAEAQIVWHG